MKGKLLVLRGGAPETVELPKGEFVLGAARPGDRPGHAPDAPPSVRFAFEERAGTWSASQVAAPSGGGAFFCTADR